jgi:starch synthase (maltosyl-transferring)
VAEAKRRVAKPAVPPAVPDVVVEAVQPLVDGGRFAAKAVVNDRFVVSADVFAHGHEVVRALLRHRRSGAERWESTVMRPLGNDRFAASFVPSDVGPLEVEVVAGLDDLASWARDSRRRLEGGRPDPFDPEIGSRLLTQAAVLLESGAEGRDGAEDVLALADQVAAGLDLSLVSAVESSLAPPGPLSDRPIPSGSGTTAVLNVYVEPERAAFSSWYELFPRSAGADAGRAGTLRDVIDRLDYVASLGFDVLYLPPVHPIGVTARKGRGNSPTAKAGDVGSPWAIGAESGGHEAIAAELGNHDDFERLVREARARGIAVAMDLAFQCSPDHPWVKAHPEWFRHRPDGSIACAENPPKRYEDIYPIDFRTADREGLWQALHDVTMSWVERGVRIFRVDNPHTKPFSFWEWLLAELKTSHPELIFLSEAFTRPKVMHRLAKLGFDQSYTYFTWRDSKWEITEYFDELAHGPGVSYFRPNVWPNTPDILAKSLQRGGRASFIQRLVLAGGLAANYGIYGPVFELQWDRPAAPGSEEYLNSEKYEVHHHDLADPRSLAFLIRRLNLARRSHPALQRDDSLRFLPVDNDQIVAWLKRDAEGNDIVIGVVNLDSAWVQSGFVEVDLSDLGVGSGETFRVRDLLGEEAYLWQTGRNFVKLDPAGVPAHLLALERGR